MKNTDSKFYVDDLVRLWYGLDALKQLVAPHCHFGNHRHEKFLKDVETLHNDLTAKMATAFKDYIAYAVMDEMEDSIYEAQYTSTSVLALRDDMKKKNRGTATIWEVFERRDYFSILRTADVLFGENNTWARYFGGKAWSRIVRGFSYARHLNDAVFVDWVVDLQHNTGCFLNKRNPIFETREIRSHAFKQYLKTKRYGSLEEVIEEVPYSREFKTLLRRGMLIMYPRLDEDWTNVPMEHNILAGRVLSNYHGYMEPMDDKVWSILDYEPVRWGSVRMDATLVFNERFDANDDYRF